jgi:hypothetical protein
VAIVARQRGLFLSGRKKPTVSSFQTSSFPFSGAREPGAHETRGSLAGLRDEMADDKLLSRTSLIHQPRTSSRGGRQSGDARLARRSPYVRRLGSDLSLLERRDCFVPPRRDSQRRLMRLVLRKGHYCVMTAFPVGRSSLFHECVGLSAPSEMRSPSGRGSVTVRPRIVRSGSAR